MAVTGHLIENSDRFASGVDIDELGQKTGQRWAKIFAPSSGMALTWPELPARGTPFGDGHDDLFVSGYSVRPDGGLWWVVRIGYRSTLSNASGVEPNFTSGLRYTRFGHEEGTITIESDIDGEPLGDEGAQAIVRYPTIEIVHHRTTPFPPGLTLGLVAGAGRLANFAVRNSVATEVPAFEWDAEGGAGSSGVVFNPGELLYQRTQPPEYLGQGRHIVRHFMRAAPDFKHYRFKTDEDGNRIEIASEIYPEADLRELWA